MKKRKKVAISLKKLTIAGLNDLSKNVIKGGLSTIEPETLDDKCILGKVKN